MLLWLWLVFLLFLLSAERKSHKYTDRAYNEDSPVVLTSYTSKPSLTNSSTSVIPSHTDYNGGLDHQPEPEQHAIIAGRL